MFSMTALLVLPILADVFVRDEWSGEVDLVQSRVFLGRSGQRMCVLERELWAAALGGMTGLPS